LRRRLGLLDFRSTSRSFARIVIASAALAGVAFGVWWPIDHALGRSFGAQLLSVGTALVAGTITYLAACKVLRVRELGALLALRTRLART
jgi:putative peptidoglycan lipid II flippase